MGALSFLLGLNLAIISAHAAVHFAGELIRGDPPGQAGERDGPGGADGPRGVSGRSRGAGPRSSTSFISVADGSEGGIVRATEKETDINDKEREKERERERVDDGTGRKHKQCPLCMDRVTHPAAPQCGHVFCWTCIHTWANTHAHPTSRNTRPTTRTGGGSGGADVKCPVCRCPFQRQTVRALFGYS